LVSDTFPVRSSAIRGIEPDSPLLLFQVIAFRSIPALGVSGRQIDLRGVFFLDCADYRSGD
jgi:hypothetical protein